MLVTSRRDGVVRIAPGRPRTRHTPTQPPLTRTRARTTCPRIPRLDGHNDGAPLEEGGMTTAVVPMLEFVITLGGVLGVFFGFTFGLLWLWNR